jgi:hypothetical protein
LSLQLRQHVVGLGGIRRTNRAISSERTVGSSMGMRVPEVARRSWRMAGRRGDTGTSRYRFGVEERILSDEIHDLRASEKRTPMLGGGDVTSDGSGRAPP